MLPSVTMDLPDAKKLDARILIIDDDDSCASALVKFLQRSGYNDCLVFTDAEAAVADLNNFAPDLVLLDLHMKPFSGIDVLKRIRKESSPSSRPAVLVLTADTTAEARHEALAAGATDFLAKPVDAVEMILRIGNILTARNLFEQCQLYRQELERLVDRRTAELQKKTSDLEKTIVELRETQQQVIQQERMRALGTMASGIAHDLNNGLSLILGYGDMLIGSNKFPRGSKERTQLEEMVSAGRDNAELVKRLREFYRPCTVDEHRTAVDVNELVDEALLQTAPRWQSKANAGGATIRIKKDFGDVPLIIGAPAELREVLTNLIFNAMDAMPRGGDMSFRTQARDGYIELAVSDTGVGMSEQVRRNCLEPFFTTKGDRGSGLGLAMSYGIVRRHGGNIIIESTIGEGTTFTLLLPVPDKAIERQKRQSTQSVRPMRILVVDDHPGIREIVSAYLAEDRHIVETAADAHQAMDKFQKARFDLVITDRAMPEMNGDQLAASIKQVKPGEPIIMLTGFADLVNETGQTAEHVDYVLPKPARLDDLRKAIREVVPQNAAE